MENSKNQDEILYCARCGISFVWSQEEQRALPVRGSNLKPQLCPGCRRLLPSPGRERGLIKWYSRRKQYGFVLRAGQADIYVHRSNIMGRQLPKPGDLVEFTVTTTPRGPAAADLTILEIHGDPATPKT